MEDYRPLLKECMCVLCRRGRFLFAACYFLYRNYRMIYKERKYLYCIYNNKTLQVYGKRLQRFMAEF